MQTSLISLAIAFVSTVLVSLFMLHGRGKIVVKIKPELADVQAKKAGTPSIGGVAFCIGATIAAIPFMVSAVPLISMWLFALIGLWDDMEKTKTDNGDGLAPKKKLLLQFFCAILSVMAMHLGGEIDTVVFSHQLGFWYYPLAVLYIMFFVNAVNITDGLDGLAALVSLLPLIMLAIIQGGPFLFAFIGALLAFLIFNWKPARYFMGDAGSHAIGAVLAVTALSEKCELLTLVSSVPLIIELASSLLQIVSIRAQGKKIFTIAPLHHAFEKKGLAEGRIVLGYACLSVLTSALALLLWLRG